MNYTKLKVMKLLGVSSFLILILTSCSSNKVSNIDTVFKTFSGSNNFESFVDDMVDESSHKLKKVLYKDDIVLVSDFVNLDKLKNRSRLGFLLSDYLKNALSNRDIIVRQVELKENFDLGDRGFNLLTRDGNKIQKKYVDIANYAVVGTYSITTENLIVFIKLIDLRNGNILSSSTNRTAIDKEILDLEEKPKKQRDIFLPPHMVL